MDAVREFLFGFFVTVLIVSSAVTVYSATMLVRTLLNRPAGRGG